MTFQPAVSVIIPIYNGQSDLEDLLRCLGAQTYPRDRVEYFIVDNNSSDNTLERLQTAAQKAASDGWGLRVLQESAIQSSYAARNRGICAANAPLLAFTDADCRPEPTWLERLMQPFENPAIGLVAGEVQALPGSSLLEQYADRQETLSQKHTLAHPFCPYGQTANLALRRSLLESVGLFRPYLTTGGDADLCWRILRETACQWHFAESAIVRHRHRQTLAELLSQWRRYGRSNRFLHDLHGIGLMAEPLPKYYGYRLARWGLKEFPIALLRLLFRQSSLVDLINTPIGLLCLNARWQGQQQAQLPEPAREIAPFPTKAAL
ncbi:glycosyltransferase [Alkalinema sp. FACHB-956]|uniref:glycosyltransferase n=1 Tax=Alkalinema sp. FACHB-956 TaxID=2692768 RepID=UPI0016828763|nr:glycosyltransferase [Alkalinema sp. FACHB-956]MBD2325439.1 glycosyltransferase [Alkalinema sp. FACHB-956]